MIDIDNVSYRYRNSDAPALEKLGLTIRQGSLFGLLGPNGSGKTTLISILSGLLPVMSGTVRIGGHDVATHLREVLPMLSLVPQEYAFYPTLTVLENLKFFAGVRGLHPEVVSLRVREALTLSALEDAQHRSASRLSGGMKRRLNIAIGILNHPRVLLLDEPTVGIDPQSRHFILEGIRRLNAEGTTVVYATHYMDEVESLCEDIAILDGGRVLRQGTLKDLLAQDGGHRHLEALFLALTRRQLRDT